MIFTLEQNGITFICPLSGSLLFKKQRSGSNDSVCMNSINCGFARFDSIFLWDYINIFMSCRVELINLHRRNCKSRIGWWGPCSPWLLLRLFEKWSVCSRSKARTPLQRSFPWQVACFNFCRSKFVHSYSDSFFASVLACVSDSDENALPSGLVADNVSSSCIAVSASDKSGTDSNSSLPDTVTQLEYPPNELGWNAAGHSNPFLETIFFLRAVALCRREHCSGLVAP